MTTENIEIINGCTKIENQKYAGNKNLTAVIICDGVRYIGGRAFADCRNLKFVCLPDSIQLIADDSFENSGILLENTDRFNKKMQLIMFFCKKNSYADIWTQEKNKYIVVNT